MTTIDLRSAAAAALEGDAAVRGLTVKQPWAAAIAWGKTRENRTRRSYYRGLVLIQASKAADRDALREAPTDLPGLQVRGAVVAVARMTGCHLATDCAGRCTHWAQAGLNIWHWELADHLALRDPVPTTGALGLWHPTPALRRQAAAVRAGEPDTAAHAP